MTIVVRCPNWLGDVVMAAPAIAGIIRSATATGDEVVLAARPELLSVLAAIPGASTCRRIAVPRGKETESLRTVDARRIVLLTHSFSTAWSAWRAGIPERVGEARHLRSPLLTRVLPPSRTFLHQADEYGRIAREAGYEPEPGSPRLEPPPRPSIEGLADDANYIVLAPGARYGAAKRWPHFDALADDLTDAGHNVVILGAKGENEEPHLQDDRPAPKPRLHSFHFDIDGDDNPVPSARPTFTLGDAIDLCGRTTMAEALAIVAHADAVVANDSGLAHVAAAMGRRTVVLFGPTDPERTRPRTTDDWIVSIVRGEAECAPCLLRTCPIDHRCLRELAPRRVFDHVVHPVGVGSVATSRSGPRSSQTP